MLSYQHAYHAGSLVDVHKHIALTALLNALSKKPNVHYFETHAGRGLYHLQGKEAQKTGEAEAGITRLIAEKRLPLGNPFLDCLLKLRKKYGDDAYPGSPLLAQMLLPAQARLNLMELHPQEYSALRENLVGRNIRAYKKDGYPTTLSLLPPQSKHGLVLIDPSYEVKSEYAQAAEFIRHVYSQWPEGIVMLWYPILESGAHQAMLATIGKTAYPRTWQQEIHFPPLAKGRMRGSGLFCINTPREALAKLEKIPAMLETTK